MTITISDTQQEQAQPIKTLPSIEELWQEAGFKPNPAQEEAIRHIDGPLYLTAGPGSGKTRVLLWRTLNLIVYHKVAPDEIFLATFTEKAALQLREGLRFLLGIVTNHTDQPYDIANMYVGTVHSLCQRLIMDRRFYPNHQRPKLPQLLDELDQYFHVSTKRNWLALTALTGLTTDLEANKAINQPFGKGGSKYDAVTNAISFFNRLSEEQLDPANLLATFQNLDPDTELLIKLYIKYKASLVATNNATAGLTDFALLQQHAYDILQNFSEADKVFKYVIVDEYQDTNTIQEHLYFKLAAGHKNICVVGDDDQALYRFRGATVENFVQFPKRCMSYLNQPPKEIALSTNYRSRKNIVDFYTTFISHPTCDWQKPGTAGEYYRVVNKNIQAHSTDTNQAVIASTPGDTTDVCEEIAEFVKKLLDEGKVEDPNQIAFLFPSLKVVSVKKMITALEGLNLKVYAPRAGRFLEVEEATAVFGIFIQIFGKPDKGAFGGQDYNDFHKWLDTAAQKGAELVQADPKLWRYVQDRKTELATAVKDYKALLKQAENKGWNLQDVYNIDTMKRDLINTPNISLIAKKRLGSRAFENIAKKVAAEGTPFKLKYVFTRAASIDWNVLDLFYRLCGFDYFQKMFDLAESDDKRMRDEGPVANLGLITQYLARFMDKYVKVITAEILDNETFKHTFFSSYLYALFRSSESEYEDANDPFPKGRIPFLTIHQSKGLEFPVVILGSPRKDDKGPQTIEKLVNPLLVGQDREPLDRVAQFDTMRMFYVALSRAKNLLVIAHYKGKGLSINEPFKTLLDPVAHFPRIATFDTSTLPAAGAAEEKLPRNYSYTGDFLTYRKCPRQYMIFRKFGFVPSRSQTQFFGSLVHKTLEDLHEHLISAKANQQSSNQTAGVTAENGDNH